MDLAIERRPQRRPALAQRDPADRVTQRPRHQLAATLGALSLQIEHQRQLVEQQTRQEEVLAHTLSAELGLALRLERVAKQPDERFRTLLDRVDQLAAKRHRPRPKRQDRRRRCATAARAAWSATPSCC